MTASVRRALRTAGGRKIGTALLTASTPVRAVQPLANARAIIHKPAIWTPCERCGPDEAASGAG